MTLDGLAVLRRNRKTMRRRRDQAAAKARRREAKGDWNEAEHYARSAGRWQDRIDDVSALINRKEGRPNASR